MNRSRTPVHSFNARLYAVLALAACFWLALIASIMLLALPNASDTHGTVDKALPDLRSSLHLPYFSFARALRPVS